MRTMVALVALGLAPFASAASLYTDSFSYTTGQSLPSPWVVTPGSEAPAALWAATDGLSFPGVTSAGQAAQTTDRVVSARVPLNGSITTAGGNTTQTVYMSYLFKLTSGASWGDNLLVGLTGSTWTYGEGLYAGVYQDAGKAYFGVTAGPRANASTSNAAVAVGTAEVLTNTTYLVLAKYEIDTANGWTDIPGGLRANLKIYTDTAPLSEPGTWDVSLTADKLNPLYDPSNGLTRAVLYRGNSSLNGTVDELKIGNEFGDVIAVPEPTAMASLLLAGGLLVRRRKTAY